MSAACIFCPCCGDEAATGIVYNGQPLDCGCEGHIMVCTETEPSVYAEDCACQDADPAT